jgi:Endonuclease NucS
MVLNRNDQMSIPISATQRNAILSLIGDGLEAPDIAAQVGVTNQQVAAVKAWVTMGRLSLPSKVETIDGTGTSTEVESEVTEPANATFGLERDLQLNLRQNIDQLESGLAIIDNGRERTVPSGRIDITARDRDGMIVVIELKAGTADHKAIGQVLGYMGDLMDRAV